MKVMGVDPGGTGALALLHGNDLVAVEDMPVFIVKRGRGNKPEIDVYALRDIIERWQPDAAWFEQVGARPEDAPSAAFNFGRGTGLAEGAARLFCGRFEQVAPHIWKKEMKLIKTAKDDSRAMATSRWPKFAETFRRKKDDGRAEAALLAEYGRRQLIKEGVFG